MDMWTMHPKSISCVLFVELLSLTSSFQESGQEVNVSSKFAKTQGLIHKSLKTPLGLISPTKSAFLLGMFGSTKFVPIFSSSIFPLYACPLLRHLTTGAVVFRHLCNAPSYSTNPLLPPHYASNSPEYTILWTFICPQCSIIQLGLTCWWKIWK